MLTMAKLHKLTASFGVLVSVATCCRWGAVTVIGGYGIALIAGLAIAMSSSSPGKAFQGRGNIDNEHGVWRDSAMMLQVTCLVHMLTGSCVHTWPVMVQRRNLLFILDGAGRWLPTVGQSVRYTMDAMASCRLETSPMRYTWV